MFLVRDCSLDFVDDNFVYHGNFILFSLFNYSTLACYALRLFLLTNVLRMRYRIDGACNQMAHFMPVAYWGLLNFDLLFNVQLCKCYQPSPLIPATDVARQIPINFRLSNGDRMARAHRLLFTMVHQTKQKKSFLVQNVKCSTHQYI